MLILMLKVVGVVGRGAGVGVDIVDVDISIQVGDVEVVGCC